MQDLTSHPEKTDIEIDLGNQDEYFEDEKNEADDVSFKIQHRTAKFWLFWYRQQRLQN